MLKGFLTDTGTNNFGGFPYVLETEAIGIPASIYGPEHEYGAPGSEKQAVIGQPIGPILTGIYNSIQIVIFTNIYGGIAAKLNAWENHKFDTEFEDALIMKTFLFEFV